jgi:hypothetical protein
MPKVLNKHRDIPLPAGAVYVGRPTRWGNTFVLGRDGTRDQVVQKYKTWINTQPELLDSLEDLRGKDLVCWCAPHACHADILLELANR